MIQYLLYISILVGLLVPGCGPEPVAREPDRPVALPVTDDLPVYSLRVVESAEAQTRARIDARSLGDDELRARLQEYCERYRVVEQWAGFMQALDIHGVEHGLDTGGVWGETWRKAVTGLFLNCNGDRYSIQEALKREASTRGYLENWYAIASLNVPQLEAERERIALGVLMDIYGIDPDDVLVESFLD